MRSSDDRGKLVKVIPAHQLAGAGRLWCPLPRDIRLLVNARLRAGGSKEIYAPLLIWAVLVVCSINLWMPSFVRFASSLPTMSWLAGALLGMFIPFSMFPFVYWTGWRMRRRVARAIITEGHCATCGYAIEGLVPEVDGCTVCPECGSAWRLSPAPEPESPDRA